MGSLDIRFSGTLIHLGLRNNKNKIIFFKQEYAYGIYKYLIHRSEEDSPRIWINGTKKWTQQISLNSLDPHRD